MYKYGRKMYHTSERWWFLLTARPDTYSHTSTRLKLLMRIKRTTSKTKSSHFLKKTLFILVRMLSLINLLEYMLGRARRLVPTCIVIRTLIRSSFWVAAFRWAGYICECNSRVYIYICIYIYIYIYTYMYINTYICIHTYIW